MVSIVGTSTNLNPLAGDWQKKCFYANGLWWSFYYDGTNFGWRTSTDGTNWSSFSTYGAYSSLRMDIWYDEPNNKICLVRSQGSTSNIYYRQGTANGDGTITWDSNEVQITTDKGMNPTLCKDSNGYPWVAYAIYSTYDHRVCQATATDGSSWGTPVTLWSSMTINSAILIVSLTGGKMLAIAMKSNALSQSRLYHDATWDSAVNIGTSNSQSTFGAGDAVADSDNVHFTFLKYSTYDIIYNKYIYGTGWGSEETVESATVNQYHPSITWKDTDKVRVFYFLTQTTIKYRDRDSGSWQTAVIISSGESTMTCLTSSYKVVSNNLCVTWKSGAASPYNVKFDGYTLGGAPTSKSFSDVGGGSDAFINPYRAMGISDVGHGAEAFNTPFRAMGFSDVGSGVDIFTLLRMLAFSDSSLGSDSFAKEILGAILKAFSDTGLGSDAFTILFKAMKFSDFGLGTDVFSIYFKALIFSDFGSGADAFSKWILGEIVSKTFSDAGLGADIWRGANLIEAPLVIVTADGKIILRISLATKDKPDYIMLS